MATKVRTISVNLSAGTAKFFTDMDAASAKIKQFGGHGVSSMQATSGALRELEGNFGNNIRAVERFVGTTLGLGPILQKAFPVIGAVALGGVIVELSAKAYKFFKDMSDGPERVAGSLRSLNASIRLTNDALDVANAKLENEIAKLEGRHENTSKLALAEMRAEADRLAQALQDDLAALDKLMRAERGNWFTRLVNQGDSTASSLALELGGETGYGGFRGKIADERDPDKLKAAYEEEIRKVQKMLTDARGPGNYAYGPVPVFNTDVKTEELFKGTIRDLIEEQRNISKEARHAALTGTTESLEADKANRRADENESGNPLEKKLADLRAQLAGVNAELASVGQNHAAQVLTKAFAEADVEIARLNVLLKEASERKGVIGPPALIPPDQIRSLYGQIAAAKDQTEWAQKIDATSKKLQDEIAVQNLLTDAIGKGYAAVRAAHVEASVMQEMGPERYNDDPHGADANKIRTAESLAYDAQHGSQSGESVQKLKEEIELERDLVFVQRLGAEAVRQRTFEVKAAQMEAAGATREQIAAEKGLFDAQRANASAAAVAGIEQRIAATRRLMVAILGGAEAERQAALENNYAKMQRAGALPAEIDATRHADELDHQRQITAEALKLGMVHQDELAHVNQEITALETLKEKEGESLAVETALRDLEKERLRIMAQQGLAMGDARNGARAFFLEMQADGKTAGEVIHDVLKQATNEGENLFAKALADLSTGQYKKGEFSASVKQMGSSLVETGLKELVHTLSGKKADGSKGSPFHVLVDNSGGYQSGVGSGEAPEREGLDGILGISREEGAGEGSGEGAKGVLAPTIERLAIDWLRSVLGRKTLGSGEAPETEGLDGILRISKGENSDEGSGEGTPVLPDLDTYTPPVLKHSDAISVIGSLFRGGFLGKSFGGGDLSGGGGDGDGGIPDVSSLIEYGGAMGGGGPVRPGFAYRIHDGNEGELFLPGKSGNIVPLSKLPGGGGNPRITINHNVDARGAELGAANRMARALESTHHAAVNTAMHAIVEHQKRTPRGR